MQAATRTTTRTLPASRRFLATPTGRPAPLATDKTTNLGAQSPAGYGGTGGPIPQAGPPPPTPKKSNVGVYVGLAALVAGSATWYLTQEPEGTAVRDLHKLEEGAKHEIDLLRTGARSSSAPLGPTPGAGAREAERYVDNLRSPDDKFGAQQVKDALKSDARDVKQEASAWGSTLKHDAAKDVRGAEKEVSRWGDALSTSAKEEKAAFKPFVSEVAAWKKALTSGPDEKKAWSEFTNELRQARDLLRGKDKEYGVEQVESYLRGKGVESHNVVRGGNPWLDWIGGGKGVRVRSAERKLNDLEKEGKSYLDDFAASVKGEYNRATSSLSHAVDDAKAEGKAWLSWGEKKAEEAKYKTEAEYERAKAAAKDEASSWSNWTSAKASDAKAAVNNAASSVESSASSAYNSAASSASSAYNQTANAASNAGEKAKAEGQSWWNWSGEKAEEGKDKTKEGLLWAEKKVEHGAQEAQRETKKL
ncbi:hypothetical protein JCM8547_005487 [Rhodosporidiobolus lusitaniae]